jgi:hypothetical protein
MAGLPQRPLRAGFRDAFWDDSVESRVTGGKSFLPVGLRRFQRRAEEVSLLIREAFLRGISTPSDRLGLDALKLAFVKVCKVETGIREHALAVTA